MAEKLAEFFKVKKGEELLVLYLIGFTFCEGISVVFLYTASRALFLSRFDAADLSYVYTGVAFVLIITGKLFSFFNRITTSRKLFIVSFAAMFAALISVRLLLTIHDPTWVILSLAIMFDVVFLLTSLVFSGTCSRLLDMRQAKRLYGLVGSGFYLAMGLGGLANPLILHFISVPDLIYISMLGLCAGVLILRRIFHLTGHPDHQADKKQPRKSRISQIRIFKDSYLKSLHIVWAVSVVCLFLIDAAISHEAEQQYRHSSDLAGFFGILFAGMAFLVLILRGVASSRMIDRLGVTNALYLLPASILVVCIAILIFSFIMPEGSIIFMLTVGLRLCDYVFRHSIHKPAFLVLYQPLKLQDRLAAQASVESVAKSLPILLVGALIWISRQFFTMNGVNTSWFLMFFIIIWILSIIAINRKYMTVLVEAMKNQVFSSADTDFSDRSSLCVIARRLESQNSAEVIFCMDLLEKHAPDEMKNTLMGMLFHPSKIVVMDALRRIEILRLTHLADDVEELIEEADDSEIMECALKTYAALGQTEVMKKIIPFLSHESLRVRKGAIVGLIHYCGIEGILAAGEILLKLRDSEHTDERKTAAEALGDIGQYSFYNPLIPLLNDEQTIVRRCALAACEKVLNPRLVPSLIKNLMSHEIKNLAVKALASIGPAAIPPLADAFSKNHQHRRVQIGIIRSIGRISCRDSLRFLTGNIFHPDTGLRIHMLSALQHQGYQAEKDDKQCIFKYIQKEAEDAAWLLNAVFTVSKNLDLKMLSTALTDEYKETVKRILFLLSFVYPSVSVVKAQKNLSHPDRNRQAYAIEIIDSLISNDQKKFILPLIEDTSERARLEQLSRVFGLKQINVETILLAIAEHKINSIGSWSQCISLYCMGFIGSNVFNPTLKKMAEHEDTVIRETSSWSLSKLKEKGFVNC